MHVKHKVNHEKLLDYRKMAMLSSQ